LARAFESKRGDARVVGVGARAARGRVDIARRRARGQTRARSIGGNARRARSIGEVGARAARERWLNIARGGDARERGERDARARARGGFAADWSIGVYAVAGRCGRRSWTRARGAGGRAGERDAFGESVL